MTAFSAATDAIFADPNMGQAATYTPAGGSAVAVRIVPKRPTQDQFAAYSGRAYVPAAMADIRVSDVANPAEGDALAWTDPDTGEAMSYVVAAARRDGLVWTLDLNVA